MTTSTTDAEAIARETWRAIETYLDAECNLGSCGDLSDADRANCENFITNAILSYLASRREAQEPVAWLRDLDGTGSLHPASQGDPEAFAVYRTAPPAPAGISDDQIIAIWRAAMTASCNMVIGRQNRLNDDDGPCDVLNEQGEIASQIKRILEPDELYIGEIRQMIGAVPAPAGEAERLREAQEPVDWIYEDELPSSYPYGRMFAYSKVRDGVRMFPVYAPSPAPAGEVEMLRGALEIAREVHFKAASIASGLPKEDPEHLRWLHHSYGADEVAYKIDAALNGGRHD